MFHRSISASRSACCVWGRLCGSEVPCKERDITKDPDILQEWCPSGIIWSKFWAYYSACRSEGQRSIPLHYGEVLVQNIFQYSQSPSPRYNFNYSEQIISHRQALCICRGRIGRKGGLEIHREKTQSFGWKDVGNQKRHLSLASVWWATPLHMLVLKMNWSFLKNT